MGHRVGLNSSNHTHWVTHWVTRPMLTFNFLLHINTYTNFKPCMWKLFTSVKNDRSVGYEIKICFYLYMNKKTRPLFHFRLNYPLYWFIFKAKGDEFCWVLNRDRNWCWYIIEDVHLTITICLKKIHLMLIKAKCIVILLKQLE
jgi:hypothetical protein